MKEFFNSLKQESYLFKHSPLLWIHIGIPLLGVLVLSLYFLGADQKNEILSFMIMISLAYPFAIGVVCGVSAGMEWESGYLHRMNTFPGSPATPYLTKLAYLLWTGLLTVVFAVVVFALVHYEWNVGKIEWSFLFLSILILWLTAVPVYLIQYIISFRFGHIGGVSLGVAGSLIAALMETGLGEGRWMYSIWGGGARLLAINSLPKKERLYFIGEVNAYILFSIIITSALVIGLVVFAKAWEGRMEVED